MFRFSFLKLKLLPAAGACLPEKIIIIFFFSSALLVPPVADLFLASRICFFSPRPYVLRQEIFPIISFFPNEQQGERGRGARRQKNFYFFFGVRVQEELEE